MALFRGGRRASSGVAFAALVTMWPDMTDTGWGSIDSHQVERLEELFAKDGERVRKLTIEAAGLTFDWSKTTS